MELLKLFFFLLILAVGTVSSMPAEPAKIADVPVDSSPSTSAKDLDTSETVAGLNGIIPGVGGLGLSLNLPSLFSGGLFNLPSLFSPSFPMTYAIQPGIGYVPMWRQRIDPAVLTIGR